jgi:carbamoylphosphate synthase small subunit
MSRTQFKQSVGESLIPKEKVLNLSNQKSKLKTKMGLAEEGTIIIRGINTRHVVVGSPSLRSDDALEK